MVNFIDNKCSFCSSKNGKIGNSLRDTQTLEMMDGVFQFVCMDCGKISMVTLKRTMSMDNIKNA